jgi:hypothetical protein
MKGLAALVISIGALAVAEAEGINLTRRGCERRVHDQGERRHEMDRLLIDF